MMTTPASSNTSSTTSGGRWDALKEPGSGSSGFNRPRTMSSRGSQNVGRGGGRSGSGGGGLDRAPSSQGRAKAISLTAKATIAHELGDKFSGPSRPRPGPPARRSSRAGPPPVTVAGAGTLHSTKASEPPTPSGATGAGTRPSNRRRRSHATRGSKSKTTINPTEAKEGLEDVSAGSEQPPVSSISDDNAPIRDPPPHLIKTPEEPTTAVKNNLDALVERVRSVAIERPSTPSASHHIDWAGEDDDSLPDLDDWGITTTTSSATPHSRSSIVTQAMSPIIASLRTLPDPAKGATPPARPKSLEPPSILDSIPTQSSPLTQTVLAVPPPPPPAGISGYEPNESDKQTTSPRSNHKTPRNPHSRLDSPKVKPSLKGFLDEDDGPSVADSIHAPKAEAAKDPLFGDIGNQDGLKASMWASDSPPSATAAASNVSSYSDLNSLHGNGEHRSGGGGRGRHRGGAFSIDSRNRRGGEGDGAGWGGGGRQRDDKSNHSRAKSSPSMSSRPNRPIITGDAISRLARTIAAKPKGAAAAVDS